MFQIIINSALIIGFLCHTSCDLLDLQLTPWVIPAITLNNSTWTKILVTQAISHDAIYCTIFANVEKVEKNVIMYIKTDDSNSF
jgi:hypothetical protein